MQHAKIIDAEACRQLLNSEERAVLLLDPQQGNIRASSPLMQRLLDYSAKEITARSLADLGRESDLLARQAKVQQLCADGHLRWEDLPLMTRDGLTINMEFQNLGSAPDGGLLIDGIVHNILPRPAVPDKSASPQPPAAYTSMQAIPSYREQFIDEAHRECDRAARYQRSLSLLCIELERIEAGTRNNQRRLADLMLGNLTASLEQKLRVCDIMGRTGVGEWVVLLPEVDANGARHVASRLHKALARQVVAVKSGGARTLEARIGVASSAGPDANYDLLHDQALAARESQQLAALDTH